MRNPFLPTLLSVAAFSLSSLLMADTGLSISIRLNNVATTEGRILLYVYRSADGFPTKLDQADRRMEVPATTNPIQIELERGGEIAIAVCHDENSNGSCDTNFLGIPKEGLGVSNDAEGRFGPPKFEDAKVTVDTGDSELSIKLNY